MHNLTPFVVNIPSFSKKIFFYPKWIRVSIINALYSVHVNATSNSIVEPKSNFRLFQPQIRLSRI